MMTRPRGFIRATAMIVAIGLVTPVSAQDHGIQPTCRDCRVQARVSAVLESGVQEGTFQGPPVNVGEDLQGRLWLFSFGTPPLVFDSAGKFLETVGRAGDGPGEYRFANAVAGIPGDSVLVFDQAGRATVLDRSLAAARTITIPARFVWQAEIVSWPHHVIMNALIPTQDAIGWPLHTADLGGNQAVFTKSFGANEGELDPTPGEFVHLRTFIARGGPEQYFGIDVSRYRVAEWDSHGLERGRFDRSPAWFAGKSSLLIGGPQHPPAPRTAGAWRDPSGHLWTFILVPSPSYGQAWQNVALDSRGGFAAEVKASEIRYPDLYRTRIEVLDPETRTVKVVAESHRFVIGVLPSGRVVTYAEDENGVPVITILRFNLVDGSR